MDELSKRDVATLEWWTLREVANHWRISTDTVLRLIAGGKVQARRFGAQWRVHSDAVAAYESGDVSPAPKKRRARRQLAEVPDYVGGEVA